MVASGGGEPALGTAPVCGRTMAWREAGDAGAAALPLVMLHGIGSNASAWPGQFSKFAAERRVVAWNAPGYAGSDPLPAEWPAPYDYAEVLAALLDHLGIANCVLVGQSLGAIMAAAFACRWPERVAALVLASPASGYGLTPGDPLPPALARRIDDARTLGPEGLARARYARLLSSRAGPAAHAVVRQAMAEIVPHGYTQAVRLLACADLPRAVAGLTVPTTVLWGSDDVVTPPETCRRVAEAVPGGHAVSIIGGGHAVAVEMPLQFNQVLRPVIARADTQARPVA